MEQERKIRTANLRHARQGKISCRYGAVAVAVALIILGMLLKNQEAVGGVIGGLGLCGILFSFCGFRAALRGLQERNRKYSTCRIGLVVNGFVGLLLVGIWIGGL